MDKDTSYHQQTQTQPLPIPPHSQLRPRGQGYQVAQTASYLPPTDPPSPPSPPEEQFLPTKAIPSVPSLDSYYQFQNQRTSWATPAIVAPEQERLRRLSTYRRDRINDNMSSNATTEGPLYPSQASSVPQPPAPPPHRNSFSQEPSAMYPSPDRVFDSNPVSPVSLQHSRSGQLPPIQTRPLSQLESPSFLPDFGHGSPTRSDRSFISDSSRARTPYHASSYSSSTALAASAAYPGIGPPPRRTTTLSTRTLSPSPYQLQYDHAPYTSHAPSLRPESRLDLGVINPTELADDDDDDYTPRGPAHRRMTAIAGGAGTAAGGGVALKAFGAKDPSGSYGQVYDGSVEEVEKSAWLSKQATGKRRLKWWAIGVAVLVVLAIIGGVVGAILARKPAPSPSSSTPQTDSGVLTISSPEITALLNNKALHKVFPGIDYTPYGSQYPNCLTSPPSQHNVTKDIAILSQLTNKVRLYGTDCGQTEMVLSAISALDLNSTMSVYMGIWLDSNTTTNARQLKQAYDVLTNYPATHFSGVIVGNEVLFRTDMTEGQLITEITAVKANLTNLGITLPVGTSDLGSKWSAALATAVDMVMANVHPFFGGVVAAQAASWTWSFWQTNDVAVTTGLTGKTNIISEVGWPSSGGNDCGAGATCTSTTEGAVAGISEMNTFMGDWVCQALTNGTDYFWFEAFDEPWKSVYNTGSEQWETAWGLMDANRNLKSGVTIPSCGGKTVS